MGLAGSRSLTHTKQQTIKYTNQNASVLLTTISSTRSLRLVVVQGTVLIGRVSAQLTKLVASPAGPATPGPSCALAEVDAWATNMFTELNREPPATPILCPEQQELTTDKFLFRNELLSTPNMAFVSS